MTLTLQHYRATHTFGVQGPGWIATVILSLAALYALSVLVVYFAITRFMMKDAHVGDE